MKTTIKYSKFECNLISTTPKYDEIVKKFHENFSNYYSFNFDEESENNFTIYLCDHVDKDIFNSTCLNRILIHNSHSKNDKILLNGLVYKQKNALKHVYKISQNNIDFFNIIETGTYIKLTEKKLLMCGENIYEDLVYVFETLLNTFLEAFGNISLHAASCLINNEGVIICGSSGSGKTTLLFDLIKNCNAIFQANDRVSIYKENNELYICGIPIPVNVPHKTMTSMDNWCDTELVKNSKSNNKIRFSVKEIPLLFDEIISNDIKLKKIFITNFNCNQKPSVKRIDSIEALENLEILSPFDPCHPNWLNVYSSNQTNITIETSLKNWLKNIEIYVLSGNNLYESFCRI